MKGPSEIGIDLLNDHFSIGKMVDKPGSFHTSGSLGIYLLQYQAPGQRFRIARNGTDSSWSCICQVRTIINVVLAQPKHVEESGPKASRFPYKMLVHSWQSEEIHPETQKAPYGEGRPCRRVPHLFGNNPHVENEGDPSCFLDQAVWKGQLQQLQSVGQNSSNTSFLAKFAIFWT